MITVSADYASLYTTNQEKNSSAASLSTASVEKTSTAAKTISETAGSKESDEDTAVTLTLSKIQQYMSRSHQLQNEAARDDISASGKQQIQDEINKINVVINNLSIGNDSDEVENMVNSIDMTGDLVPHSMEQILLNAEDAYQAQMGPSNMEAYALLM